MQQYFERNNKGTKTTPTYAILMSLLLALNIFIAESAAFLIRLYREYFS